MTNSKRIKTEVNTGSMADIAFLLLIFFLVTTQIATDKGLQIRLPPAVLDQPILPKHEHNIFKIQINSQGDLMVEKNELKDPADLHDMVIEFVSNNRVNPNLSDSPKAAVVSIKTDRGTEYKTFISVLDQVQGAYYSMRATKVGLSSQQFRNLDRQNPKERILYERGKEGLPIQISIAEPSNVEKMIQ